MSWPMVWPGQVAPTMSQPPPPTAMNPSLGHPAPPPQPSQTATSAIGGTAATANNAYPYNPYGQMAHEQQYYMQQQSWQQWQTYQQQYAQWYAQYGEQVCQLNPLKLLRLVHTFEIISVFSINEIWLTMLLPISLLRHFQIRNHHCRHQIQLETCHKISIRNRPTYNNPHHQLQSIQLLLIMNYPQMHRIPRIQIIGKKVQT